MLKKDDKRPSGRGRSTNSPCMIVFCSFEQMETGTETKQKSAIENLAKACEEFVKNIGG